MPKVKPSGKKMEIECEQGTDEWFKVRMGMPTASMFKSVIAGGEGKMRREYMRKLAGELLTGYPMEGYRGAAMVRGIEMEDELRKWYTFRNQELKVRRVGFIVNGARGCSPDSAVGDRCGLEIKSQAPHLLFDTIADGRLPPEHKAQIQGTMLVAEWEWVDLVIGYGTKPGFDGIRPFQLRIMRDDAYIDMLDRELTQFTKELGALVASMRA